MTNSSTKRGTKGEITSAALLTKSKTILLGALGDLEAVIAKLGKNLRAARAKKHDRDGWSHHAWLTKQVSQVAGEVRKLEAGERSHGAKLTLALVLAFARSLGPSDRSALIAEIEAMDDEGSVLG